MTIPDGMAQIVEAALEEVAAVAVAAVVVAVVKVVVAPIRAIGSIGGERMEERTIHSKVVVTVRMAIMAAATTTHCSIQQPFVRVLWMSSS